jgi:hypothetical protein
MTTDEHAILSETAQNEDDSQQAHHENETSEAISEEKILLKTLKSYFKLCSAAEDKRIFLKVTI